jgi:hypothetical protein
MDIFHPDKPTDWRRAILTAAMSPPSFRALRERFSQSTPSAEAIGSYLVRQGFIDRAIPLVTSAYTETCHFLEQENAFEGGGVPPDLAPESPPDGLEDGSEEVIADPPRESFSRNASPKREREKMEGERTLLIGAGWREGNRTADQKAGVRQGNPRREICETRSRGRVLKQ